MLEQSCSNSMTELFFADLSAQGVASAAPIGNTPSCDCPTKTSPFLQIMTDNQQRNEAKKSPITNGFNVNFNKTLSQLPSSRKERKSFSQLLHESQVQMRKPLPQLLREARVQMSRELALWENSRETVVTKPLVYKKVTLDEPVLKRQRNFSYIRMVARRKWEQETDKMLDEPVLKRQRNFSYIRMVARRKWEQETDKMWDSVSICL
jgi:hypothetical protein